jgi:hypothetical protein
LRVLSQRQCPGVLCPLEVGSYIANPRHRPNGIAKQEPPTVGSLNPLCQIQNAAVWISAGLSDLAKIQQLLDALATLWHILVSVARRFLTGWVATISPRIRQPGSGGRAELGRANMRGSGTCPTAARQRIALLPSSPSLAVVSKRNSRDSSSRLTSSAGDQLSPVQVSTLG